MTDIATLQMLAVDEATSPSIKAIICDTTSSTGTLFEFFEFLETEE